MKASGATLTALALILSLPALAGEAAPKISPAADDCCDRNFWTGEGVTLGGILFPEFNYQSVVGSSSMDPAKLAVGHHDPNRHGITQQNIEFSLAARLGKYISLFGNYNAVIDHEDHWFAEYEEHYAVIHGLPLGIELKGGRFFTQFGYHNREHLHDFTFIDKYLVNGRLIGEDSASVYGGEISLPVWRSLPSRWSDRLTASYGAVPDPMEEGEEEEGPETKFEGEGGGWQDWLATVDYSLFFAANDVTRYEFGVSGAWGRNNFDRHTQVYGVHFEYLWRPDGTAGVDSCCHKDRSRFLRWRTEAMLRHVEASNEDGERGDFTDAGFYTAVSYGLPGGKVQAHLKGEYVSGVAEAGLSERWRLSPALSWHPSKKLPFFFKVQYNCDYSPAFGNEHSVWAQFSLTWGDCCAHEH